MRVGYNPKKGRIKTDSGVTIDRAFIAHMVLTAAQALAASTTGVLAATNLDDEEQLFTVGINSPAVPRALSITGNVSGITGDVVITGTNFAGEEIEETIALNGTATVNGNKAFETVDMIELPVEVHAPVQQVETATVAGTVTEAGDAAVTVTSALFDEAVVVAVPVEVDDDAAAIALAIRTALTADSDIAEHFVVSGATDKVILTAKLPASNDATLNIAIATGTATGVETAATSENTTAGVPYDIVSVGWNDKIGLPYLLAHNTVLKAYLNNVLEGTAPTVTVSPTAIESNTVDLHSALNGSAVDIYLIV